MLTVLGGLAEFERELIRARTGEGRERAKAGREAWSAAEDHASPDPREIARTFNVSHSTISRLVEP
jgi:DNA invertase Pin-like site-specific DNA recombinase